MLRIKTPATSANLGIGYDTLGLALDIYNVFEIKISDQFKLIGFHDDNSLETNLVYTSYISLCNKYNKKPTPIEIHLIKNEIPISRGLGSSASLILAGVVAANIFHNINLDKNKMASFAATIEGHPDNIYACMFGKVTAVFKEKQYLFNQFKVSNDIKFTLLYPNKKGSTKELRNLMPEVLKIEDTVHNLSRIIHLPKALESGNIDLLHVLLNDKIHEPYRYQKIHLNSEIQKLRKDLTITISGSGPTLLVWSKANILHRLDSLEDTYTIKETTISDGLSYEVIS